MKFTRQQIMSKQGFLTRPVASLALALLAATGAQGADPPNIIMVLADDLGYGDIGCYGHPEIATPNLDRMAQEGVRFTSFYAPASTCSPTRAAILTGRNPYRLGIYTFIPANSTMHLKAEERTLATILRDRGYDTCFVGKWGCNGSLTGDQPQPDDHGFDYWLAAQNNAIPSHRDPTCFVRNGQPCGEIRGYSAGIIVDEAISWLKGRRDQSKPFCLFVWFQEPHRVIATPEAFVAPYRERFGDTTVPAKNPAKAGLAPSVAEYLGNISHMDHQVGRLLTALNSLGVADNTLTVFTSDNGPVDPGSKDNLRGSKGTLWEGGIRVPAIVRWPQSVKPGLVCDTPAGSVDLLPTICAIAGAPPLQDRFLDGTDISPLFQGAAIERVTPLFWRYARGSAAMREGDWKIHGFPAPRRSSQSAIDYIAEAELVRFELYNLREDRSEARDLAATQPERVSSMSAKLVELYKATQREGERWTGRALPKAIEN